VPPKTRTVAFPVSPSAILPPTIPVSLRRHYALGPDFGTGGNYPGFEVTPERDEQLACHGHNGDPPRAPSQGADALAELLPARCRVGSEARAMRAPFGRRIAKTGNSNSARPSIAALTRSGARKASEIVMLTLRTLHCWRAAICSTSVAVPVTTSSSQRRPRSTAAIP
jgi:hypothetical protein